MGKNVSEEERKFKDEFTDMFNSNKGLNGSRC